MINLDDYLSWDSLRSNVTLRNLFLTLGPQKDVGKGRICVWGGLPAADEAVWLVGERVLEYPPFAPEPVGNSTIFFSIRRVG